MKTRLVASAAPLLTKIQQLFSEDLAKENDFLRQENRILRGNLGKRIALADTDRRTFGPEVCKSTNDKPWGHQVLLLMSRVEGGKSGDEDLISQGMYRG